MVNSYLIESGKVVKANEAEGNILIYMMPTPDEINDLVNNHGLDSYNVNSSLDPDELGRMDYDDGHIMLIIKRPKNYSSEDELVFKITSIGLFIFKNKLIIIMPEDIEIMNFKQVKKLKTIHDFILKLIFGTISHFLGHLKTISMIADSLEQKMDKSVESKYLRNMFSIQKSLVYYLNGINSNGVVFEKMKNNSKRIGFNPDNVEHIEEIMIENSQCYKQAEIYANIITGIMNTHASIVGNNLNITIHRLTFITTIFMPLTLLASIGGMSEWTTLTKDYMDLRLSYLLFFGLMGLMGIVTYIALKKISHYVKDTANIRVNFFKRLFGRKNISDK